ncbi:MAG: GspH/FimT family pseudopilin [Magnetococcales bacterium]|nr:GspH/FimT family pseudopilin [Magnetococcales bacterium]
MSEKNGFTLIELLITLVLFSILASQTAPLVESMIQNSRMTSRTNGILGVFQMARSEAIRRGNRVTACRSTDLEECDTGAEGGWELGILVFEDMDNSGDRDPATEEIVQVYESFNEHGDTLRGSANVNNYLSFSVQGTAQLANGAVQTGDLILCDSRGWSDHAKALTLSATGRMESVTATDTSQSSCSP